jgi:hypothetical protein
MHLHDAGGVDNFAPLAYLPTAQKTGNRATKCNPLKTLENPLNMQ